MFGLVALFCAAAWLLAILWRNNSIGILFPLGVGAWIGFGLGSLEGRPIRGALFGALAILAAFAIVGLIIYLFTGFPVVHSSAR